MKYKIITLISFLFILNSVCFAGWSSYEGESYKFTYDVEGEIEVKPDTAVLPLIITVNSKSYSESLKKVRTMIDGIQKDVTALNEKVFSISPSDFYKPEEYGKDSFDVSFFGGKDDSLHAKLVFNIYIAFNKEHDFWKRAEFIAKANDYASSLSKKFDKNDQISIEIEKIYYEISNIEQYRSEIIKSIYTKAQSMAKIVAQAEKVELRVDEVKFDQHIKTEVINFNRASLSINAQINFTFDHNPQAKE